MRAAEAKIWPTSEGGAEIEYPSGKTVTLTSEGLKEVQDTINQTTINVGATGQSGPSVLTEDPEVVNKVAKNIGEKVTGGGYGESYGDSGYSFEADLEEYGMSLGTEPAAALFIPYGGLLLSAGSTFYLGYEIGSLLRGVLGFEGTGNEKIEGCECGNVHLYRIESEPTNLFLGEHETSAARTRVEIDVHKSEIAYFSHTGYGYGSRNDGWIESIFNWSEKCKEPASDPEWMLPPNKAVLSVYKEINTFCERGPSSGGEKNPIYETRMAAVTATLGKSGMTKAIKNGIKKYGWPSKTTSFTGTREITSVSAPTKLASPPPRPKVETEISRGGAQVEPTVPAVVTTQVVNELSTSGAPGISGKTESELVPELPRPRPTETGTEYKTELETGGWTTVKLRTLTEAQTDPQVGPEEVAYTVPASGSHVAYNTEVVVEQNPSSASTPGEGIITEPGFHVPSFGVLCEKFPFGVPCWVVSVMSSWSTTAEAPEWTIPLESPTHGLISNLKLELKPLNKMMEVIRAAFLVVSTIGAVLLFFKWAIGGAGNESTGGDE